MSATHTKSEEPVSMPAAVLRGWDRFWFTPTDPAPVALMRIFTGLIVFYVNLTYSWGLFGYIGPDGWLNHRIADYLQKETPIYSQGWGWNDAIFQASKGNYYWSIFYHVQDPAWIIAFHVLFVVVPLLFALGLWTRITGALAWVAAMSYCQRSLNTVYGLDTMMMIVLTYLNLAPTGAVWSLDRWLELRRARARGEAEPPVQPSYGANFAVRLTQVHFCIIYLATGTSKLLGTTWWAGTSLNLVLLNNAFAPLDTPLYYQTMKFLATHRVLWEVVMTSSIAFTLGLEMAFPFLIWNHRTRWFMICCSVTLHTGIGLFMGLGTFSLMMMVMLISFVPPEVVRALVAALAASVSSWRAEPAKASKLALSR